MNDLLWCHFFESCAVLLVVLQLDLDSCRAVLHVRLDDLDLLNDGEARHVALLKGLSKLGVLLVDHLELLIDGFLMLISHGAIVVRHALHFLAISIEFVGA